MSTRLVNLRFGFLGKVNLTAGCWNWKAGMFQNGYGSASFKGKTVKASRLSYELFCGRIPKGLFVLHRCDNKKCVRPDHLFLGTHQDNVDDMVKKKRNNRGEDRPLSKLTRLVVEKIKLLFGTGKFTKTELGKRFNIDRAVIGRIVNGTAWLP